MIISQFVSVKRRGNKNLKYYQDLGYDITKGEFKVKVCDLTKNSKCLISAKCYFCDKIVEKVYYLYLRNISSNGLFACSSKCGKNKSIMTNVKNIGVEWANQSDKIKEKSKMTSIVNWGVDNPMKSEVVKKKVKSNNLKKWGVEWTLESVKIRKKIKKTNLKNWGVDHNFKSTEVRKRIKKTLLENWGVDNPSKSEEVKSIKKQTSIRNWGVDNPSKSEEIKKSKRVTCLKNWGVEYPQQNSEIQKKSQDTLIRKWGVDHNMKIPNIIELMKANNIKNWGVEWTLQSPEIKESIKRTNLENWGVDHPFLNEEFRILNFNISKDNNYLSYLGNNLSLFRCKDGHNFEISSVNYFSRIRSKLPLCTVCNPIGDSVSIKELDLYKFINSVYTNQIIQSYRDGLEIDIYLPDLHLGFEFNGLYWHSEEKKSKGYHLDKTNYFKERGIRIIHIWEDDWDNRKEIIKSQIGNWVGSSTQKIPARKCKIGLIKEPKVIREFLDLNHIQGYLRSDINIGLFHQDKLVSIMTFDRNEGRKKMGPGEWNLSRFCSKIDTLVLGSASKLFSYFLANYSPKRVISYSDKNWSKGDIYTKLGFSLVSETRPDYKYIVDNKRVHKSRFRKSRTSTDLTESEWAKNSKILRVWDCGKMKFEFLVQ
jgi:hypothetical protein